MAILKETFIDIDNILSQNEIKKVLIIGDQTFNRSTIHYPDYLYERYQTYKQYLKEKYSEIEFEVLDIQGMVDLKIDLNFVHEISKKYDLIIDSGTSEHVDNQYSYIININNWLEEGGFYYTASLNRNRCIDTKQFQWLDHCFYYYDKEYFNFLSECFDWNIIEYKFGYIEDATLPINLCLYKKNKHIIKYELVKKVYEFINLNLEESIVTKLNMSDIELSKKFIKDLKNI